MDYNIKQGWNITIKQDVATDCSWTNNLISSTLDLTSNSIWKKI